MKTLKIIQANVRDADFGNFEKLIPILYPKDKIAFKQFEAVNTDYLHSVYIAFEDDQPVGRCCLYFNPVLEYQGFKTFCIGNFECIQDSTVAKKILDQAEQKAKQMGGVYMIGPMNGSIWDSYRFAINNSNPNFFLESYHPDYYSRFFLESSYESLARYVSNIDKNPNLAEERIQKVESRFEAEGITFRCIDILNFEEELDTLHDFCLESFQKNFLFTPISKARFIEKYMKVKPFINPEYVLIAEDKNRRTVGLVFCIENFADKQERGLIVKTLAKKPLLRYGGLGNVLVTRIKQKALAEGFSYFIHAFMIESNASKSLSQHYSAQLLREYYLYVKKLYP